MSVKASEVMDSGEVLMWERHTTKKPNPDGSLTLTLVEGVMPDGKPCTANLAAGWKPKMAIQVWNQHVKGEFNAREAKQEAAAIKRAEASKSGGERSDPAPAVYGGSPIPTAAAVQDCEASVEAIIESKISSLGRSLALVEAQIEATLGALKSLELDRDALKAQRAKAIMAIRAMKET